MLKKNLSFTIIILFLFAPSLVFALTTPAGLTLVPGDKSIEVSWIANSDSTTDYYLYSGLTAANIEPPLIISGQGSNSHTLAPLLPNTTYYVAISAYDNFANIESGRSPVLSATTLDSAGLSAPTGLWIDSAFGIGTTHAGFQWTASSEPDISYYTIYYGTATGIYDNSRSTSDTATFLNVTGLSPSTRYYVALSVTDSSPAESARSAEIVVDTLPDSNVPNVPGTPQAAISGSGEIEISFTDNNENMADFSHFVVAYDTVSTFLSFSANAGSQNSYRLGGLTIGSDYYFAVKAVDRRGNESSYSGTGHILVEEVRGYLDKSTMKEGCFIATAVFGSYDHPFVKVLREFRDSYLKSNAPGRKFIHFYYKEGPQAAAYVKKNFVFRVLSFLFLLPLIIMAFLLVKLGPLAATFLFLSPLLLRYRKYAFMSFVAFFLFLPQPQNAVAGENHTVGMKIGYFEPSDDDQSEYYDATPMISLFYDLNMASFLSTELSAGYLYREGDVLTISGKKTAIESELTMVPLSLSMKFHLPITAYIGTYLGAGGDYWYFKEKSKVSDETLELGGYHGKIGLVLKKLPNLFDDKLARNFKVTLEAVYSRIDRFGDNERDLGGWTFNAGASISF
ncbi:MAG: fibronectin type III domain-containing protein [Deltaproteobacteria bacterium]|nr:fibronectin type III domain-containing protein [Deltaproteobacteria bacterium]